MQQTIHKVKKTTGKKSLCTASEEVLKVLAYFDIFRYPLKKEEIIRYRGQAGMGERIGPALEELITDGLIFFHEGFYSLHNDPLLASKRTKDNHRAACLLPKALAIGRFLYRFPFVRGIGISGSLSKDVADENADIDFFIITKRNRLWIARTFMHLFKKLTYLRGRQHFYCMNYYVDEEALLLTDQNIYTAIEIKTLLPVCGRDGFHRFFKANQWSHQWLPACDDRVQQQADPPKTILKKMVEWVFNNRSGDKLDNFLLHITTRRWQQKETKGRRNVKGDKFGLMTSKHFAKSNPGNFHEKVLVAYDANLKKMRELWNIE